MGRQRTHEYHEGEREDPHGVRQRKGLQPGWFAGFEGRVRQDACRGGQDVKNDDVSPKLFEIESLKPGSICACFETHVSIPLCNAVGLARSYCDETRPCRCFRDCPLSGGINCFGRNKAPEDDHQNDEGSQIEEDIHRIRDTFKNICSAEIEEKGRCHLTFRNSQPLQQESTRVAPSHDGNRLGTGPVTGNEGTVTAPTGS